MPSAEFSKCGAHLLYMNHMSKVIPNDRLIWFSKERVRRDQVGEKRIHASATNQLLGRHTLIFTTLCHTILH